MAATVPPSAIDALSSVNVYSQLNINDPKVYHKLVLARNHQGAEYFDMLMMLGYQEGFSQEKVTHFEDDWLIETFNSNATVTQAVAGANIVIRLSPQNLDSNNKFYPRLWDVVQFPNNTKGTIILITGAGTSTVDVTIRPQKTTMVIGTVNAGQELPIITNNFSEGSDQPDGVFSKTRQFDCYMQQIKETFSVTGSAQSNSTWFDMMTDGTGLTYYVYKGREDMDYRMKIKAAGALLVGETIDNNIVDPSTGFAIQGTEGLDPYIRNNGNTVNYNVGTWSVKQFNGINTILDREFAGNYYMGLLGPAFAKENEDALVDFSKNTNISFTEKAFKSEFFGGDDGVAMKIGFSYLEKSGRGFGFKTFNMLDHQKGLGAQGFNYSNNFYFVPLGKTKDSKSNNEVPYIGMIYKQLGADNRKAVAYDLRGAGINPNQYTLSRDIANYYMRMNIGARHMAGNQMVIGLPN